MPNLPPALPTHLLTLHRTEAFLASQVAAFVLDGLAAGEGALVITSAARWSGIEDALADHGFDVGTALAAGTLAHKDAAETLDGILGGRMDGEHLAAEVGPAIAGVRDAALTPQVRVFGDMVDVLWAAGRTADAVRLEQAWHDVLKAEHVTLLCAYCADALGPTTNPNHLLQACRIHGAIVAVEDGAARRAAIRHGMEAILGSRELGRLETVLAGAGLPGGEGDAETALLWLRTQVPRIAQRVMTHAATALAGAAALDA